MSKPICRKNKEIEYKKEMGSFVVRKCKTLDELITEYVALYGKENCKIEPTVKKIPSS